MIFDYLRVKKRGTVLFSASETIHVARLVGAVSHLVPFHLCTKFSINVASAKIGRAMCRQTHSDVHRVAA